MMKKLAAGAMAFTLLLSACGNSEPQGQGTEASEQGASAGIEESAADQPSESGTAQGSQNSTAQGAQNGTAMEGYHIDWDDMAEIRMLYPSMGPVPSGLQAVEDAVNEITEKEINTHVDIEIYEIGNYDQQVGLMMSSGESLDLMLTLPSGSAGFSSMQTQGQLMDITDILETYGQPHCKSFGMGN